MSFFDRLLSLLPGGGQWEDPDIGTPLPVRGERSSATRAKIFVAPSITEDPVTEAMSRWLTEAFHSLREGVTETLSGESATADEFRVLLKRYRSRPMLVVFYGHGTADGLSFERPGASATSGSNVCTAADFTDDMDVQIVAFCCSAAAGLGRGLHRLKSSAVIGFRDEIGLVIGKPEHQKAFATPMGEAVREVCQTNVIDELTKSNLEQSYQAEQARWMAGGECARDSRALLVAMFLSQHRRLLYVNSRA